VKDPGTTDPYRRIAARYDRSMEGPAASLRRRALTLCPPRENASILELACGTGTLLALYERPGCSLAGVDLSPSMLAAARAKLGARADLREESAAHTSFPDHGFDLVIASLALHEMPHDVRVAVLAEARRVVRPGGAVLVIDYHPGPYPFPRGWLMQAYVLLMEKGAGREHYRNYRDFVRRGGLDPLVAGSGLTVRRRFIADVGVAAIFVFDA
jgi:ubiquinone/menaquinone biosynthesis C-methylase UbiE